jgi:hypothetical protein
VCPRDFVIIISSGTHTPPRCYWIAWSKRRPFPSYPIVNYSQFEVPKTLQGKFHGPIYYITISTAARTDTSQ